MVQISKGEYDSAPPLFLMKLSAAMERREYLEKQAIEKAKKEQEEQGK